MKSDKNIHPVDTYVGNRLRTIRLEKSLSQEDLGKAVDLTFQQIQKYERGLNRISASKLYDFANFLNVNISFFFKGYDGSTSDYSSSEKNNFISLCDSNDDYDNPVSSKELQDLAAHFSSVDDLEVRKSMLKIIESIANEYNNSNKNPKKKPTKN